MSTPDATLTPPQTFEQRLLARIRDSIGELMSDEDLKKVLDRGVENALFVGKEVKDNWGHVTGTTASLVESIVKELLSEKMEAAVRTWCAENEQRMQSAVETAVQVGVGHCMLQALDARVGKALFNLRTEITQSLARQ